MVVVVVVVVVLKSPQKVPPKEAQFSGVVKPLILKQAHLSPERKASERINRTCAWKRASPCKTACRSTVNATQDACRVVCIARVVRIAAGAGASHGTLQLWDLRIVSASCVLQEIEAWLFSGVAKQHSFREAVVCRATRSLPLGSTSAS